MLGGMEGTVGLDGWSEMDGDVKGWGRSSARTTSAEVPLVISILEWRI